MPVKFLIVSEAELLAQILLEEDVLRERLEKALDKLKNGQTILKEQITKLSSPSVDPSLVSLRADEVRKFLLDSVSSTREVAADFTRILREMEVNKVSSKRTEPVETRIVKPLGEILDPVNGNFALTDAAVAKLWDGLEADLARRSKAEAAKKTDPDAQEADRQEHLRRATEAQDQNAALMLRMQQILDAIGGEISEADLLRQVVELEKDQRDQAKRLFDAWKKAYEYFLKEATQ
jgi:hypothetical protein